MPTPETPLRPLILFLHIPKTGGTTLKAIIRDQYPSGAVQTLEGAHRNPFQLFELCRHLPPETAVIQGHMGFGVHRFLPRPSSYIALLRDPINRVISSYYFQLRVPEWPAARKLLSEGRSLYEFVSSGDFPEASNRQTAFLSGGPSSGQPCSRDQLEAAKRNLREQFPIVGLTERFDETLILLRRTFRWKSVFYLRENVDPDRTQRPPVDHETLRAIEKANQLDMELYHDAQTLFEDAIRSQGPGFRIEVEIFKRLNTLYARGLHPRRLYARAASALRV